MTTFTRNPGADDRALEAVRAATEVDRFELADNAADMGLVTDEVATQWAVGNALPVEFEAVIAQQPAEDQGKIRRDFLARPKIRRTGALVPVLAALYGLTPVQLDQLFGIEA